MASKRAGPDRESLMRFPARASISMSNFRSVRRGQMCSASSLARKRIVKADIRDRPILLLLAVYGLRVGEAQRLGLEDINLGVVTWSILLPRVPRFTQSEPPLESSIAPMMKLD